MPRISRCLVSVVVLLLLPLLSQAQPLADKLPADAMVYVGWSGADSLGPGFDQSHLKAVLDASNMRQVFDEFLPKLMEMIGQQEPKAGEAMAVFSAIGPNLWKHPSALYIGTFDLSNPQQPKPRAAILCDAGNDAKPMLDAINKLLGQARGEIPVPLKAVAAGNLVVVMIGDMPDFEALIGLKAVAGEVAPPLAQNKTFAATMGKLNKSPVLAAYVDGERVLKLVDQGVAMGPPEARDMWPKVRDAIGLDGLKRFAMTAGFEGKDWSSQAFLDAPAPRKGFIGSMMQVKPLSDDLLKSVPKSSTVMAACRFDAGQLLTEVRAAAAKVEPRAAGEFDKAMGEANKAIGMDIQKDILQPLGSEWAVFSSPEISGVGMLGLTLVGRPTDPAKLTTTFGQLEQKANAAIAQQDPKAPKAIFQQTKVGDLDVHYLAVPFVTPCWAVKGGTCYAALYPQVLASAADAAGGASILDNAAYQDLRKRLGVNNPVSITFVDLPRTAPEGYQVILMLSRVIGFADFINVKSPVMIVPPLSKLTPHLSPAGGVSWIDDEGWHAKSISPFPGSELLAGQAGMATAFAGVAPLAAGMALPAIGKARESATSVKCAANLRQIGMGCMMYSNENKGQFPPSLGATIEYLPNPDAFICPTSGTQVPAELRNKAMDPKQMAQKTADWVNANSDYVYVGAGKNMNKMDAAAETVIAYDKPGHHGQMVNVLYGDGHVEAIPQDVLNRQLAPPAKPKGGDL